MTSPRHSSYDEHVDGRNGPDQQPCGKPSNIWDCLDATNREIEDFGNEVNELAEQMKLFKEGLKEFKEDVKQLNKDLEVFKDSTKIFRNSIKTFSDDSGVYRIRLCNAGH